MTEASHTPVAVIVPARDAAGTIGDQLEALTAQTNAPPFEVVVVANRCSDDTLGVATRFSSDRVFVRCVVADERASAALARNAGVRATGARTLLFCDADDRVGPDWVRAMSDGLDNADLVGGALRPDLRGVPGWIRRNYVTDTPPGLILFDGRIRYPASASVACRRDAFEAVGGFDESFEGATAEDLDLAVRFARAGYRVGFVPAATVQYRLRSKFREFVRQRSRYAAGDAILLADAGALGPSRWWDETKRFLRRTARRSIRCRELDVRAYLADALLTVARLRAQRKARAKCNPLTGGVEPVVDFTFPLDVPVIGGLGAFAPRDAAEWHASGRAEAQSLELLRRVLPSGGTFVDVGAHIGSHTLAAAKLVGPSGRVHSFEASAVMADTLRANVERHRLEDRVTVHSVAPGGVAPHTLDGIVDERVDALEIRVDGYEPEVLDGATELIRANRDLVVIARLSPAALARAGYRVDDVLDRLPAPPGRRCWIVEDSPESPFAGRARALDDVLEWLRKGNGSSWYANVVSVPTTHEATVLSGTVNRPPRAASPPSL